jgi:phospholipase C
MQLTQGAATFHRSTNIKHIVVLMFENRSFDHIFGVLLNSDGLPLVNGGLGPDGKVNTDWTATPICNTPSPTQEPNQGTNQRTYPNPVNPANQPHFGPNHDFWDGMMPDLFGLGRLAMRGDDRSARRRRRTR